GKVVESIVSICRARGCKFHFNAPVEEILAAQDRATGVRVHGRSFDFDAVVAAADYHHVEEKLLPPSLRNYGDSYWKSKTFAPSCLIFYLGVNKKLGSLQHHTLFFEEDFLQHSIDIYKEPKWPAKPLFYVCCPSKTDPGVAPEDHENLFLLMPLAPGIEDTEALREEYFRIMMARLEKKIGEAVLPHIDYKHSYCVRNFIEDYHSYKGNAYGLANTLMQTAILKPKIKNRKLHNLFYAGQLTVPGPGVPPALISGKIAATELLKTLKKKEHEEVV